LNRFCERIDARDLIANLMKTCCNVALGSDDAKCKLVASCPLIFGIMKNYPTDSVIQRKGYETIQRLAFRSKSNAKRLLDNDAMNLVVKGVKDGRDRVVEHALRALANICSSYSDNNYDLELLNRGVLGAVLEVAKKVPTPPAFVMGRGKSFGGEGGGGQLSSSSFVGGNKVAAALAMVVMVMILYCVNGHSTLLL